MKTENRNTIISVGVVAGAGILAYLLFRPKKAEKAGVPDESTGIETSGGSSGGFTPSQQCLKDVVSLGYGSDVRAFQRDWNKVRAYINVVVSAGEATAQFIANMFGVTVGNLNDTMWKTDIEDDGDCGPITETRSGWVLRGGVINSPLQNWPELVTLAYAYEPPGN